MLSTFKDYLVEAKFDGENMERVISAFQRRMPKLLGSPIYRFGGKEGTDGQGILFFFKNKAFRLRVSGSSIKGIDVWDEYKINKGPSYFISLAEFGAESILASMTKLAGVIKNPSAGKVAVKEEMQLAEMAKRAAPEEFYKMGKKMYGGKVNALRWHEIEDIAKENDVLIPGYVKSQMDRANKTWSIIPDDDSSTSSNTSSDDESSSSDDGGVKVGELFFKVTKLDPDSGKFFSAHDNKEAQKMLKVLQASINSKPSAEELKDPETMYGHMAQLVEMACKGKLRSLLIYGGPGTGKTYTIMQTVNKEGLQAGKDYVKLSGKATPVSIYETLFMFREGGLVIFDDLDSMWRNEEATNILKAALDTSAVREISWSSNNTENVSRWDAARREKFNKSIDAQINGDVPDEDEYDDEFDDEDSSEDTSKKKKKKDKAPGKIKYPSTFEFKGRVIFISNLKKEEFDTAILSRSAKIGMDMTPEQILARMRTILPSLGGTDIPIEKKEELIQVLLKLHGEGELDAVTMREFTKGLDILRSGAPNWKDLVVYA